MRGEQSEERKKEEDKTADFGGPTAQCMDGCKVMVSRALPGLVEASYNKI